MFIKHLNQKLRLTFEGLGTGFTLTYPSHECPFDLEVWMLQRLSLTVHKIKYGGYLDSNAQQDFDTMFKNHLN